eukprot:gene9301-12562_t
MIDSLLYVSRRSPTEALDDTVLEAIELIALSRNSELDLTGVLIATPSHFAQFLEGGRAALDAVMTSIRADARHTEVMVADAPVAGRRLFPAWRMACFGPGNFMSRHVAPMFDRHPTPLSPNEAG